MAADPSRKASFEPIVNGGTKLLICGSLPGDASLAAGHYYAHPRNQFWRLLSPVAGRDLTTLDYRRRLEALRAAGIGLWDVIGSARRAGSGDAAIVDPSPNALLPLVGALPRLRAVAFNGGTAARIGRRALEGMRIPLVPLPSSSPLHTVGLAAKQPAWSGLTTWLTD